MDIVLSVLGTVITFPLVILVVPLIKLTSPGPVIFKQERVGLDRRIRDRRQRRNGTPDNAERRSEDRRNNGGYGKPFTMFKFRTMCDEAEGGDPQWCAPGDPRVTRLGRLLRKSRIDEIPQFVNVLKGEMSIVGPRPERSYFFAEVDKDIPDFRLRLRVKPGITGLAQVEHGYTNSVEGLNQKLEYDLAYIHKLSATTDAKILLRTISVVLTGRGAY